MKNPALTDYQQRVFDFIDQMQFGKVYMVDKLAKPETRDQFIEAVKFYIDSFPYGGGVSFLRPDLKEFWRNKVGVAN